MGYGRVTKPLPRRIAKTKAPNRLLEHTSAPAAPARTAVVKVPAAIANGSLADHSEITPKEVTIHPEAKAKEKAAHTDNRQLIGRLAHPGFPRKSIKPRSIRLPGHRGGIWEEGR